MTDSSFEASFWIARQALGIALAALAIWVGIGPEVRLVLRRFRRTGPAADSLPASTAAPATGATAESRAA